MKQLTREEFIDRTQAVIRAQKIFIDSGMTNNISIAFELYQRVCADRERQLVLTTQMAGDRLPTVMDGYERPQCPDCGGDMMFRILPENKDGIKTQLVCSNPDCDTVLSSENDLAWWMKELKKKDESE